MNILRVHIFHHEDGGSRCVVADDTVTCVFNLALIFFHYSIMVYLLSSPQVSKLLSTNHPTIPRNRDSSVGIATG
jgi:hypothetical protein